MSTRMSNYDAEQFEKIMTVVRAASQNNSCDTEVRIETTGCNPRAAVTIESYLLEKFLKPPKKGE